MADVKFLFVVLDFVRLFLVLCASSASNALTCLFDATFLLAGKKYIKFYNFIAIE